jgi:hypothetical protein
VDLEALRRRDTLRRAQFNTRRLFRGIDDAAALSPAIPRNEVGINGTVTARGETIGTNLSFIDLLTKVDTPPPEFGARFEARNGPFSVYGDFFWAQLRARSCAPSASSARGAKSE